MLDLFDAMQCDFDTNPFEHIDRFHFNICINCSQNFYSDEQFASKHVSPSVSSFCVWASGWVGCVYGFLIKNPTHGHYNKIFCDEKRNISHKNDFERVRVHRPTFQVGTSNTQGSTWKGKKEREKKLKGEAKQNRFFITFWCFHSFCNTFEAALSCGIYSQIIL